MWERKYEHGRWNGLDLNILSTSIDGGKRLQVSEIPYADLPDIKVMGSKAIGIDIDVVLIGSHSLVDANMLLDNLTHSPRGELEHPWLGELALVFESYSQKIDTKLGLVSLSLKFIRDGRRTSTTLTATLASAPTSIEQQTDEVEKVSTKTFEQDVKTMGISDINTLQKEFTGLVNQLAGIANKLSIPSQMLSALNQEINRALMSISSIANAPSQFAEQLSATIDSVANAIHVDASPSNEAVDNSRAAQSMMLELVDEASPSTHYNTQLVVASVKMSNDIARIEPQESFDVVNSTGQPETILSDLTRITTEIGQRINEATQASTLESIEVYDALTALNEGVNAQINKVKKGSLAQSVITCPRLVSGLVLAQQSQCAYDLVMALNPLQHPLFLTGVVMMRTDK
ncbi:hypothetical protein JI57_03960 [Psychromonas sp. PRT-SC03]|nr:hypothetical protein JI57_03960 [Psychromonas sp. PRT-SC03]